MDPTGPPCLGGTANSLLESRLQPPPWGSTLRPLGVRREPGTRTILAWGSGHPLEACNNPHPPHPLARPPRVFPRLNVTPRKTGYYAVEGLNSFATSYFFNYLLQHLRRDMAMDDLAVLLVCVLHGFIYVPGSYFGGVMGQRVGYFACLGLGILGQGVGIAVAWAGPAAWAQVTGMAVWTASMCLVWPMLEALVSEREPRERLPGKVGLYNVVWASTAAAGFFLGGSIYRWLGPASLYGLPVAIHAAQLVMLARLKPRHDAWVASLPPTPSRDVPEPCLAHGPRFFMRLALLGNPFNYMAINTVLAIVPALSLRMGLDIQSVGWLMSAWLVVRALGFVVLWHWEGWHYHFGWYASAFVLLLAGFVGVVMAPSIAVLLLSQVALGWASALLYYSSLFYAMDGTDEHGAHGGIHEAFIGCGIFGGPAVSTAAFWATGDPGSPAWAVGLFLAAGLVAAWVIRSRARARAR